MSFASRAGPISERVVNPVAPRPTPATYPRGAGTPRKCFLLLLPNCEAGICVIFGFSLNFQPEKNILQNGRNLKKLGEKLMKKIRCPLERALIGNYCCNFRSSLAKSLIFWD